MQITKDRVKETSATAGTGNIALTGPMLGYQAFGAVCAIGDTVHYVMQDVTPGGAPAGNWEVGYGTYSAVNTLTRTQVLASSNGGALVNFPAGSKEVWLDVPAACVVQQRRTGEVGIKAAPDQAAALTLGVPSDTGTVLLGGQWDITAPATATGALVGMRSILRTAAAAFALAVVTHFQANASTVGAGSSIGTVKGFEASNGIAVGGTNYGFFTDFAAAANTWAFYSSGSAQSFFNGPVGILNNDPLGGGVLLRIQGINPSTNANVVGVYCNWTAPATVTIGATGFHSAITSAAVVYTLPYVRHFSADATVKGSGSTITSVFGFRAANAIAVGINNYGYYSDIAANTNTWQLYMGGSAVNYFGGGVGIGNPSPVTAGGMVVVGGTHQNTTTIGYEFLANGTAPATMTARFTGFYSSLFTTAAAYTLTSLEHFHAAGGSKGSGSTVGTVYGFRANNGIAFGNINYGFYSDIANAANTFAFYGSGTAQSAFFGPVGILGVPIDSILQIGLGTVHPFGASAVTVVGVKSDYTAPATVTNTAYGVLQTIRTAAAAFTMASARLFSAESVALGAGSSITNVYGFLARNAIALGVNNFGFYSDINNAANTFQLYMAGSAASQFQGVVGLGATASPTGVALNIGIPTTINAGSLSYINLGGTIPLTTNTNANGVVWQPTTASGAIFTNAHGFYASGVTLGGGGSAVTLVYGFRAAAAIAVGTTNNYGFYTDIAANGNINYAFYSAGTAPSYFVASVGIGAGVASTVNKLMVRGSTLTDPNPSLIYLDASFPSTVTGTAYGVRSSDIGTQAASFTLGTLIHFGAQGTTKGAGSTITTMIGFNASNAIAVGVNNYGFYSGINFAATTWQFYAGGTAQSYFGGPVGIGITDAIAGGAFLRIAGTNPATGTSTYGIRSEWTVPATSTGNVVGFYSAITLPAVAFTVNDFAHIRVNATTTGAGSSISALYGVTVRATFAPSAASAVYAFHTDVAAAGGVWAFYAAGSAVSFIAAPLQLLTAISNDRDVVLRIGNGSVHPSTSVLIYGVNMSLNAPATATSGFHGVRLSLGTVAASFAIPSVNFFWAVNMALGAGSSINTIRGFYAANAIAVGANNYGFFSDINTQANTYAFYAGGTAQSYFAGPVGMNGALSPLATGILLQVSSGPSVHPSTTATVMGVSSDYTVPTTAITGAYGYYSVLRTAAAAFTVTQLNHFIALQNILGAGSTITTVRGFYASNFLAGTATNTYGFYSDIAAASNTWAFYSSGNAANFFAGHTGVGAQPTTTTTSLRVTAGLPAGATIAQAIFVDGSANVAVTSTFAGVHISVASTATAYTLANLVGYRVSSFIKGAGSTITNAIGFMAQNSLAVGTNNYGFYSDIADATTTYQLYMAGTAPSYFGGKVGFNNGNTAGTGMRIATVPLLSNAIGGGVYSDGAVAAAATTRAAYFMVNANTAGATAFGSIVGYDTGGLAAWTKGAGATVNNGIGFWASAAITSMGAANHYGFYSDINAAANTYQLYMGGTALNLLKGGLILDTTAAPVVAAGQIGFGATTAATVGAAGAAAALPAQPLGYLIINVGGTAAKVPYYNA